MNFGLFCFYENYDGDYAKVLASQTARVQYAEGLVKDVAEERMALLEQAASSAARQHLVAMRETERAPGAEQPLTR